MHQIVSNQYAALSAFELFTLYTGLHNGNFNIPPKKNTVCFLIPTYSGMLADLCPPYPEPINQCRPKNAFKECSRYALHRTYRIVELQPVPHPLCLCPFVPFVKPCFIHSASCLLVRRLWLAGDGKNSLNSTAIRRDRPRAVFDQFFDGKVHDAIVAETRRERREPSHHAMNGILSQHECISAIKCVCRDTPNLWEQ